MTDRDPAQSDIVCTVTCLDDRHELYIREAEWSKLSRWHNTEEGPCKGPCSRFAKAKCVVEQRERSGGHPAPGPVFCCHLEAVHKVCVTAGLPLLLVLLLVITYKKLECKRELKICIFMLYSFIVFPAHSKPNMWMDTSVGLQIPTACRWQWIKFATANADWLIRPNLPIMQQSLVCSTCSSGLVTSPTRCRPSVVIMENT